MHKTLTIGRIKTSSKELMDISKAWVVLSLAFAFVYSGLYFMGGNFSLAAIASRQFWFIFVISLFTAGLGFLLHELAHKFVAQKYGCVAEFRAWDAMLYLALGLAVVVGFIFAAPGAVMISGMITRRENGLVSAAGPAMNYVLGLLFLLLLFLIPSWGIVFGLGFYINMWLGLFNLIPFGNLDGLKVFQWNALVWLGMVMLGVFFVFFRPS